MSLRCKRLSDLQEQACVRRNPSRLPLRRVPVAVIIHNLRASEDPDVPIELALDELQHVTGFRGACVQGPSTEEHGGLHSLILARPQLEEDPLHGLELHVGLGDRRLRSSAPVPPQGRWHTSQEKRHAVQPQGRLPPAPVAESQFRPETAAGGHFGVKVVTLSQNGYGVVVVVVVVAVVVVAVGSRW